MIKKLSLLTILCFMSIISADELSDAIRYSDAQRVSALLSRTVLTEKQLNKYLDIADHVINARQDQLNGKVDQAHYRSSKATGISACIMLLCLMGVGGSVVMQDSNCHDTETCVVLGGISGIGMVVSGLAFFVSHSIDREKAYSNALRIKEMLHDYEAQAVETVVSVAVA
ncbi:MAG: hypothetical protein M1114_01190 [Candidatus Dependentiae bacterium]|nr:hypothetical protein [Candidatus Dependentiae bacterium]